MMKFDIESSTTTPDVMSRRYANMQVLKNLKGIVERLPFQEEDVKITDQHILEMLAAIVKIFNSGLDMSQLSSPQLSDAHGGFYCHLYQIIENRKSTKFIQKHLDFLKSGRLKGPIWILLELNQKTLLEFIQSGETQSKYLSNSAIRQGELLDILDSYYAKQIKLIGEKTKDPPTPSQKEQQTPKIYFPQPPNISNNMEGDLFDRFQLFEDIQPIKHIQSLECDDATTHAPSHRKQEQETPDIGFGSPLLQKDSILEDEIVEPEDEDHKVPLYMSFQCKKSAKLMRDFRDREQENYWHSLLKPIPNFTEKCEQCGVKIKKGFLFFTKGTARYCHFSGNYYCSTCISQQPSVIPYLVVNNYDFNEYDVSVPAFTQIQENSKKPIFQINYFDNVVYENADLYDFLVLRRQLRLMNDLLCQDFYFSAGFQPYQNLLLPINLFSLVNLKDIKSGELQKIVQNALNDGMTHIKNCPICIKLGISCAECQKGQIFIFDIVQTQYCRKCKKLFHRQCFNQKCSKCGQDQHLNRKKLLK